MFLKVLTIALAPILIFQGYKVKKNILKLSEPSGSRDGIVGQGKALSILVIGDSAAVGVGVKEQKDAMLGHLVHQLSGDYKIEWKLYAKTGNTTSQVISSLNDLKNKHYDVVVTSVGVNDVTKLMSANIWLNKQEQLYVTIQEKFTPNLIIATGVPPMQKFPALPNPLAWLFGLYAKAMNSQLDTFIKTKHNMKWIEYDLDKYQILNLKMAEDGFHPSKEIYQIWANEVENLIRYSIKTKI